MNNKKNQIAKLCEKITLQQKNNDTSKTTVQKTLDIVDTRAAIMPLNKTDGLTELFEIIMLKPPARFKNVQIASIKWNGVEYQCKSAFHTCGAKFLKGVVARRM